MTGIQGGALMHQRAIQLVVDRWALMGERGGDSCGGMGGEMHLQLIGGSWMLGAGEVSVV